jgi:hypothetical protein
MPRGDCFTLSGCSPAGGRLFPGLDCARDGGGTNAGLGDGATEGLVEGVASSAAAQHQHHGLAADIERTLDCELRLIDRVGEVRADPDKAGLGGDGVERFAFEDIHFEAAIADEKDHDGLVALYGFGLLLLEVLNPVGHRLGWGSGEKREGGESGHYISTHQIPVICTDVARRRSWKNFQMVKLAGAAKKHQTEMKLS